MRAKASASFTPSCSARWGVMPVIRVAMGEGSRSSAGCTKKLSGASITSSAGVVRTAANWAMRLRRGSAPKVSRS